MLKEQTQQPSDYIYVAFTYPYTYNDIHLSINDVEERCLRRGADKVYFHREIIGKSVEGRDLEMFTLTDSSKMTTEKESNVFCIGNKDQIDDRKNKLE